MLIDFFLLITNCVRYSCVSDCSQAGSDEDQGVLAPHGDPGDTQGPQEARGQDENCSEDLRGGQAQVAHPGDREDHLPDRVPHLQTHPCGHQPRQHGVERSRGEVQF